MAFRSNPRGQEWTNLARQRLPFWKTTFDHTRSQIPHIDLQQTLLHSSSTVLDYTSPESGSAYEPPSSPDSPTEGRRAITRSQAGCAPSEAQGTQSRYREAPFCTQQCVLGLHTGGVLDDRCPNVAFHRQSHNAPRHPTTSSDLVYSLKVQLDENIDHCTPLERRGGYGALFKLTCAIHGYTIVGKGTTSGLWREVSREAQVYQTLKKAQGSAVPVFLGAVNLAKVYFLHGFGEIRHMLLMGWGGTSIAVMEPAPWLAREVRKSTKEIMALGVIHKDLRSDNILWNQELGRALIIDFHKCQPTLQLQGMGKRQLNQTQPGNVKRLRMEEAV
ncbi:uncharacterized protein BDV14DRAFT_182241 [Aspergillus stella-maris]|uniref:uncharacterized protein n=1 Tax=Aspergillus stella-maris TaxID=1810926 RepID=UPI003CCE0CAA